MGRTGKLFASALKARGVQVVGIDLGPPDDFDEWSDQHRVPMVFDNFNSRTVLEKMNAAKARSIIFATGDDLANLEGALSAYDWLQTDNDPVRLIWAQITNDHLANTARAAVRTSGKVGIRFFDTYRIAALRMIGKYFSKEIQKEIAMAKLYTAEAARRVALNAVQIQGASGTIPEFKAIRYLLDALETIAAGGTNEIMKVVISRNLK